MSTRPRVRNQLLLGGLLPFPCIAAPVTLTVQTLRVYTEDFFTDIDRVFTGGFV